MAKINGNEIRPADVIEHQDKPAVLENAIRVLVPPFIHAGEKILIDTTELTYLRRAD